MPVNLVFPGIADAEAVSISFRPGIQPSTATIVLPLSKLAYLGSGGLLWSYQGTTVQWRNAIVTQRTIDTGPTGLKATVTISDRRWKWRYGVISGRYNKRKGEGSTIITATEKTPRQLCALCLDAMGETGYDVTLVPNDARPEVRWEVSNPAQELERLASLLGCRVVLNLASNTVQLWPVGTGTPLPPMESRLISPSTSLAALARPDTVRAYAGPSEIDTRFTLEAVGEEANGTYVPIASLSYLPSDGYFDVGCGNVIDKDNAVLARRSVYRTYRITGAAVAGHLPHNNLDNYDWESLQLLMHPTLDKRIAARAYGQFANEAAFVEQYEGWWEDDLSIDPATRIVTFSRPCYKIANNLPAAATMYLQATVKVRTSDTGGYVRRVWTEPVPGQPQQTQMVNVVRDDIRHTTRYTFSGLTTVTGTQSSLLETDAQLRAIALAEVAKHAPQVGAQARYNGIHAFNLDGFRDRVEWSWSTTQAPQTVLVANSDVNEYIPGEELRRKNMAIDRLLQRATAEELKTRDPE